MAATRVAEYAAAAEAHGSHLAQAGLAALLGLALFAAVAFAQPAAIHDAAHDSRHGIAVPCH